MSGSSGSQEPDADARVVQQRGLWFEEFEVGTVYKHAPGRTVSAAENSIFTTLTMNTQSLHLDEAWCSGHEFGTRVVNSLLTMSIVVGLSVSQLTLGTIVANLEFRSAKFLRPVYPDDTLYAESRVVDKRLSTTRPGSGIVEVEHVGRNQREQVVVSVVRASLVRCQPTQSDLGTDRAVGN